MGPNSFEYACKVTLLMKKDGNKIFYGDSRPFNMHTHKDTYPMLLIENVLTQLRFVEWFFVLDLQNRF